MYRAMDQLCVLSLFGMGLGREAPHMSGNLLTREGKGKVMVKALIAMAPRAAVINGVTAPVAPPLHPHTFSDPWGVLLLLYNPHLYFPHLVLGGKECVIWEKIQYVLSCFYHVSWQTCCFKSSINRALKQDSIGKYSSNEVVQQLRTMQVLTSLIKTGFRTIVHEISWKILNTFKPDSSSKKKTNQTNQKKKPT